MGNLNEFFRDLGRNAYGLGENVASLGSAAIAEPVAGFAAMYDPVNGAQAIREGMTYTPRTQAGKMYQQGAARTLGAIAQPAMPVIDTWQRGVDIAGGYSPMAGAALRTVPAAIGAAMGAKPALQAGRQASNSLGAMQSRMIANANAPRTLNTGYMGQRGTFAGINALTADRQALAKAQDMIARGVDPAKVWQETGWGRGADGKWRFEINDKYDITDNLDEIGSRFPVDDEITRNLISGRWKGARSTDMLSHDDLYAAYPEFKNMGIAKETGDSLGSINQNGTQAYINNTLLQRSLGGRDISKPDNAHSVLMHEIQHAIQGKEGFARGGSPDQFSGRLPFPAVLNDAQVMAMMVKGGISKEDAPWEFAKRMGRNPKGNATELLNKNDPDVLSRMTHDEHEAYRRLAGEVEARTTQSRLDLDPQQRRENYPFDYKTYGYDVPAKSQTVDFGNNKANAQRPLTEFEQAHLLAQQRAALPVNQRGLGLPANNTAMDRARAMGYDVDNPVYHGTNWDIEAFDPKKSLDVKGVHVGQKHQANHFSTGVGGANYPLLIKKQRIMEDMPDSFLNPDRLYDDFAREVQYNELTKNSYHGDLLSKAKKADEAAGFKTRDDGVIPKEKAYFRELNRILKENDIDSISYENEKEFLRNHDNTSYLIPDVRKVRSVNAAFDPKKAKSSNLLAQSAKFAPAATLGALMANEKRKDKRN